MAKKKAEKKCKDWKHIILFVMNIVIIGLLVLTLLMYIVPTYKNMIVREVAPLAYQQCQMDIAKTITDDLNTAGFTQLTIGDQKIKLGRVA